LHRIIGRRANGKVTVQMAGKWIAATGTQDEED